MGKDRGLWFPPHQSFGPLSPGLNPSSTLSHSGHQDTNLGTENFAANMVTVCGSSPVYAQLPLSHVGDGDKSHGSVYGLPNLQPSSLATPKKPCLKQISSAVLFRNQVEAAMPKAGCECAPKRFLVFDQSGDQTTLIFSSDIGKPFEGLTTATAQDMKRSLLRTSDDLVVHQGMVAREVLADNSKPDVQSEMHEDTEELNALLFSDDESEYSDEEDEVTSSGHSPSTISDHVNEEEAASIGSTDGISAFVRHSQATKRKLFERYDNGTRTMPPRDTSNSPKRNRLCFEDGNDAESSCGNTGYVTRFLPPNNEKIRKEKISETLSLLRGIVPGGDKEDPILVLDRAIDYLKSLKMEAETLGLESSGSLKV
ncbi:PREDICTED: transcription factor bHLH145 [Tarenaya hassleriana]|uniref:transcription factor bHLH145 n=1 Tax=Tarenaya hassleriana TaxID=28532 RepID=UPI00053C591A|nr:PREDICTED: transcription factor bHLH145 [Tarenaya hassleriana]